MARGVLPPAASIEWSTPQWLLDLLNEEFSFTVDVAAAPSNAKCIRYYTKDLDGLRVDWSGERIWCNPPYDVRSLTAFAKKAFAHAQAESRFIGVLLVPVKTDQAWWHAYAMRSEIRFVCGRVAFGGSNCTAAFPVCVLVFSQQHPPGMFSLIRG